MGKKDYKVISLFSGCSGMDVGIEGGFNFLGKPYPETGFKVVWEILMFLVPKNMCLCME